MLRRCIRRGLLFKFCIYWATFVASCLIIFFISASHMTVKPLQFEAPLSTLDDVFLPEVCPLNPFRSHNHSQHMIFQVSLTAEAVSVDPISRTIVMNWYPELSNPDCTSNISRVFDLYLPRWVKRTCTQISWANLASEGHSWILAVPHGVLSLQTNQPPDSMVWSSAPGTKRFLRSELSRSLSLLQSILGFIPLTAVRPSRTILSMCKFNCAQMLLATHAVLSDILLPFHSIIRTTKLGLSARPRSPEHSELQCKCFFFAQILSCLSSPHTETLRSRFSTRTWNFVVYNTFK